MARSMKIRCTVRSARMHVFPVGGQEKPFAMQRTPCAKAHGTYASKGGAVSMGWSVGRWHNKKAGGAHLHPTGRTTFPDCTLNCAPAPLRSAGSFIPQALRFSMVSNITEVFYGGVLVEKFIENLTLTETA